MAYGILQQLGRMLWIYVSEWSDLCERMECFIAGPGSLVALVELVCMTAWNLEVRMDTIWNGGT